MERLRHLARADGADPTALVGETASALRGMGDDPAGLVVACRRIVERHRTSGPMWWLCSHVVTAAEPYRTARRLADEFDADPTVDGVLSALPADSRVCTIGWPDIAGDAILRRGDVAVLALDTTADADAFAHRLWRAGIEADTVSPAALSAAVLAADLVVVEAFSASGDELLVPMGSRTAASVAYCSGVPVLAVVGVGRRLPSRTFTAMTDRIIDSTTPWESVAELMPIALCSQVVSPAGVQPADEADLTAECPVALELLKPSPN